MKHCLIIVLMTLLLGGCAPKLQTRYVPIATNTVARERIEQVPVSPDSAMLQALFECDSNNAVIMSRYNEIKTTGMQSSLEFSQGRIIYKTNTVHDTINVTVHDTIIDRQTPIEVEGPTQYINKLEWWQEALMWAGVVTLIQLALIILSSIKPK